MSKRDGDRLGFPVFPLQWKDPKSGEISSGYRESGYLPEAVINMLALLGWNPGTDQEMMDLDTLVSLFSIEKISKSGAKFDLEKAKWFNHQYIQKTADDKLYPLFEKELQKHGAQPDKDYALRVMQMIKERVHFIPEFWEQSSYFFVAPTEYDPQVIKKRWEKDTNEHLKKMMDIILSVQPYNKETAHDLVMDYVQSHGLNMGKIMNSFRLALVGTAKGPDLFEIITTIGVEETKARVDRAVKEIIVN